MSESERRYDIVIFGASGFTGQYMVDEVARTIEEHGYSWAVAGRSMSKLIQTLRNACDRTGKDLSRINVIKADVSNPESLENMALQAKIVLNCVGPYRFYGEPVVKACAENGTHHFDLCGEPGWMDRMALEYDEVAKKSGAMIIQSCGFDSIPWEMGIAYMQNEFQGELCYVEAILSINSGGQKPTLNFGTYQSGIYNAANMFGDIALHKKVMNKSLPPASHKPPFRMPVTYSSVVKDWCLNYPDASLCLVDRTQKYNYEQHRQRPIKYNTYMKPGSILRLILLMIFGSVYGVLAVFKFGRKILERWPSVISFGMFKKNGPTREQVAASSFSITLSGQGWETKLANPDEQHKNPPTKTIVSRIDGPDAAYIAAPMCMVQAAYAFLSEKENIPKQGGVYTPGSVFAKTSLIDRLNQRGVTFSMLQQ